MEEFETKQMENPNSIGEAIGFATGDIEMFQNRVYRSIRDKVAIDDLIQSGEVRSKEAAGLDSKYGNKVYWSRGKEDTYHNVQKGGYVIEAPYSIATERAVTIDDLTALYYKAETDDAEVEDILEQTLSQSLTE